MVTCQGHFTKYYSRYSRNKSLRTIARVTSQALRVGRDRRKLGPETREKRQIGGRRKRKRKIIIVRL